MKTLAAVAAIFALSGCLATSIHPFYSEPDVVFDEALLGRWSDGASTWSFEAGDDLSYRLTVVEEDEVAHLVGHLLQLGDHRYLDVYPAEPDCEHCWYYVHTLPAHSLSQLKIVGSQLEFRFLDNDVLSDQSRAGLLDVAHELRDGQVIFTAATPDLQRFVLAHAGSIFGEGERLQRLEGSSPAH